MNQSTLLSGLQIRGRESNTHSTESDLELREQDPRGIKTGLGDWLAIRRGSLGPKSGFLRKVNLCEVAGEHTFCYQSQTVQILALPFTRQVTYQSLSLLPMKWG